MMYYKDIVDKLIAMNTSDIVDRAAELSKYIKSQLNDAKSKVALIELLANTDNPDWITSKVCRLLDIQNLTDTAYDWKYMLSLPDKEITAKPES